MRAAGRIPWFRLALRALCTTATVLLLLSPAVDAKKKIPYNDLPSSGDIAPQFSIRARWNHTNLTYGFVNGTSDIAGDLEHEAVRSAMALWAAVTPFTFTEVNPVNAEIEVSWETGSHGDTDPFDGLNGILAHAFFPSAGDIHFDEAESWTTATRPNGSQPLDLVTVAAHELGHSLGLDHSSSGTLMDPLYTGSHRFLSTDDINGIQAAYTRHPPGPRVFLRRDISAGLAEIEFPYANPGDRPVIGDWNGDGTDTIGIYRPGTGEFYLRNSNTTGNADIQFAFANSEDVPVAGDWNEDGIDTIGVYRPSTGQFFLRDTNSTGAPNYSFTYGNSGDIPVAGDWNNSGTDTIGVYRPSNATFYLKNSNSAGPPDITFAAGNTGDHPVAGDWNRDGFDSIGVVRDTNGYWYLENSIATSVPEYVFPYGNVGQRIPLVGDFTNTGVDAVGIWQE